MGRPIPADVQAALDVVRTAGYVAIREKSHRQAQERQRVAEALRAAAVDDRESAMAWGRQLATEERRVRDRLVFVYGVARAHGATVTELDGPDTPPEFVALHAVQDARETDEQDRDRYRWGAAQ